MRPRGWVEVQLYSSMTAALDVVSGQQHAPAALYSRERPGTHCTGGWVDPRAGLDGRKISSPGIRSRTLQPVAQPLYRLSYPAHQLSNGNNTENDDRKHKSRSGCKHIAVCKSMSRRITVAVPVQHSRQSLYAITATLSRGNIMCRV